MKIQRISGAALLLALAARAEPCTITRPVSPEEIVRNADAIVRAVAAEYARPPRDLNTWTTGDPDSRVRFRLVEVVKGDGVPSTVILPGYLVDRDDFNDVAVPYTFVRPGGRSGSCFANVYRQRSEFLLMLKKDADGTYRVNWYPLGPINEQLRHGSDPWLLWVREQVRKGGALPVTPHTASGADVVPNPTRSGPERVRVRGRALTSCRRRRNSSSERERIRVRGNPSVRRDAGGRVFSSGS